MTRSRPPFPLDLHLVDALPDGELAGEIRALEGLSLYPPYPWGQWLYGRLFHAHWSKLPGDVVECGVARGGMSIFLARLARTAGKRVYACDSFEGLPAPRADRDNPYFRAGDYRPAPGQDNLARFTAACERHGVSDAVTPVRGFFCDTLPSLPDDLELGFLHIDADLYDSVLEVLEALYDRVVDGGVVVIDDFIHHAQGPARACADFFGRRGVYPLYHVSFPYSVFLIKGSRGHLRRRHRAVDGNFYSLDFLRADAAFIAAVEESIEHLDAGSRSRDNAGRLLDLLRRPGGRSSEHYEYLRALEDYWDFICPAGELGPEIARDVIQL